MTTCLRNRSRAENFQSWKPWSAWRDIQVALILHQSATISTCKPSTRPFHVLKTIWANQSIGHFRWWHLMDYKGENMASTTSADSRRWLHRSNKIEYADYKIPGALAVSFQNGKILPSTGTSAKNQRKYNSYQTRSRRLWCLLKIKEVRGPLFHKLRNKKVN